MNIKKSLLIAAAAGIALGASATSFAQCAASPFFTTLEKSGQGNLVCGDFTGPNGVTMQNLSNFTAVTAPTGSSTTSWSTNLSAPSALAGDKAIVEAADGRTCIYDYLVDLYADPGPLTAPSNKNIKTVTVCTDSQLRGQALSPDTDPPPIATNDGCEAQATALQDAINSQVGALADLDIAFAIGTPTGESVQQIALCSDQQLVNGTPTSSQVQCVDRCETPVGYPDTVGIDSPDCTGPFPDGRLPIACRRCATSGEPDISPPTGPNIPEGTPYCWELSSRLAVTDGSAADPPIPSQYPSQLTYRPNTVVPGGTFTWERTDGSVCYKITGQTAGGYPYSYYVPAGCPCDRSVDPTCVNINL